VEKLEAFFVNVSLTAELEKFVSAKVDSGRYNSASEVVREALRLLEEHDAARNGKLAAFNQELDRRIDSFNRGIHLSPCEVRGRLKQKSDQRRKHKP
jgi:antitoxin ParD1/3/4